MNKGVVIAIGVGIVIVAISIGVGASLMQDTSISESPTIETAEETTPTEGKTIEIHISDSAGAGDQTP